MLTHRHNFEDDLNFLRILSVFLTVYIVSKILIQLDRIGFFPKRLQRNRTIIRVLQEIYSCLTSRIEMWLLVEAYSQPGININGAMPHLGWNNV